MIAISRGLFASGSREELEDITRLQAIAQRWIFNMSPPSQSHDSILARLKRLGSIADNANKDGPGRSAYGKVRYMSLKGATAKFG
jgi:hypothetical protein